MAIKGHVSAQDLIQIPHTKSRGQLTRSLLKLIFPSKTLFIPSDDANMPLEATMIVLDNSEYMRNGDYQPTRFGALADAVTTVFQTKIDSNPENTVGVMTMANKGCVRFTFAPQKLRIQIESPPIDF